jgi:hypothetical protein
VSSLKAAFDTQVLAKSPGEVIFSCRQLVQVYRSDLDYTFKAEHKMLPKWSQPYCIRKCLCNSYKLKNHDGTAITGTFSSRRLCAFIPREGTKLAMEQQEFEENLRTKEPPIDGEDEEGDGLDEEEDEMEEDAEEQEEEEGVEDSYSWMNRFLSGEDTTLFEEGGIVASGGVDLLVLSQLVSRRSSML